MLQFIISCMQIVLVTWLCAALVLPDTILKALADDSNADTGLMWWMLHLFSLPSGVVSVTVLFSLYLKPYGQMYMWGQNILLVILYKHQQTFFKVRCPSYLPVICWLINPIFCKQLGMELLQLRHLLHC